ncbi:MAG: YbhB/YbcL family Raf kinase inhibitor-like protein [Rhodocyclales bacterium]|nr:YbhB/YbcL family Raf kinase inhibitor-like protein [Rhodocyclales bacterium]
MSITLTSSAFTHGSEIPSQYTCEGEDLSPPLAWSGIPPEARSLVLIVDDPDAPDPAAPRMTYVHWLLYNIPTSAGSLAEGVERLPAGTLVGRNDWGRADYGGPCPPIGRHHYFHKLYALDSTLPDMHNPTKAALEAQMKGHVIAKAELVGTYQKRR